MCHAKGRVQASQHEDFEMETRALRLRKIGRRAARCFQKSRRSHGPHLFNVLPDGYLQLLNGKYKIVVIGANGAGAQLFDVFVPGHLMKCRLPHTFLSKL